jgi:acyl-CoA synthetase (AMP-forming)/AMP-acid ligase II
VHDGCPRSDFLLIPCTGVLFLSPNNSPPAIAHLLTNTNATHMIVQDVLLPSATAAIAHLNDPSSVTIINQPPSDVFSAASRSLSPEKTRWNPVLEWKDEFLLPVSIIHSSGSTGFPKPIIATHKAAIGNLAMNFGLTSLTTLPLYHVGSTRLWYPDSLISPGTGTRSLQSLPRNICCKTTVPLPDWINTINVRQCYQAA